MNYSDQIPKNVLIRVPPRLIMPSPKILSDLSRLNDHFCQNFETAPPTSWPADRALHHPEKLKSIDISGFPGLNDELQQFLPKVAVRQSHSFRELSRRSKAEFHAYSQTIDMLSISCLNNSELYRALDYAFTELTGKGMEFRERPAFIKKDPRGNIVAFPDHTTCRNLLDESFTFISRFAESNVLVSAAVLLVCIVHAHPFRDGNGRTSRVLCNIIISKLLSNRHYIFISLISLIAKGAFVLKLRRAMYGQEWGAICEFLSDALTVSIKLQKT
jgi:hypothetical protein